MLSFQNAVEIIQSIATEWMGLFYSVFCTSGGVESVRKMHFFKISSA